MIHNPNAGAVGWLLAILLIATGVHEQENNTYTKNGISFDYPDSWVMTEKATTDSDAIALSNSKADAQIMIIALKKPVDAKDPVADSRKRVIDPWILSLATRYAMEKIPLVRNDIKTEAAGLPAEGVQFSFVLDGQSGRMEVCWVLVESRLVLLYMVRPDRTAEAATAGWELVRKSLKIKPKEK